MDIQAAMTVPQVNSSPTQARVSALIVLQDFIKDHMASISAILVPVGNIHHPQDNQVVKAARQVNINLTQARLDALTVLQGSSHQ